MKEIKEYLSYDDILLVPSYSDILNREEISLESNLSSNFKFELPIIASPMSTISELNMMLVMANSGGLAILHRCLTIGEQRIIIEQFKKRLPNYPIAVAIGVTKDYLERAEILVNCCNINILCIDLAHGDHILMKKALENLKQKYSNKIHLMAGNVSSAESFKRLASWGADSIRLGIGSSGICSTRLNTGHGVPLFQIIMECKELGLSAKIIADGGITWSGDFVKAYAAGADFVMCGGYLSGTDECPGEIIFVQGIPKKRYAGMSSEFVQKQLKNGTTYSIEGIETLVPYRGSTVPILKSTVQNIKSGLSYSGARTIKELQETAVFVKQTTNGLKESRLHIYEKY